MSYTFISERQAGSWVDCVPTSLLAGCIDAGANAPATLAEAKALRAKAGYPATGGTAVENYPAAIKTLYGLTLTVLSNITDRELNDALVDGVSASIEGHLSDFPLGHRLRRFAPNFTGGHCVRVIREGLDRYWWIDPAGPAGYTGEEVTWGEIATFFDWSAGILPLAMGDAVSVYESTAATGSFAVSAGSTCHAYKITAAGFVRTGAQIDTGSGRYDAALRRISGAAVPSSLLHVATGLFASFYVDTAEIDAKADAPAQTYTKAQLDAAAQSGHDAGYAQAKAKAVTSAQAI